VPIIRVPRTDPIVVDRAGAAITSDACCGHGQLAFKASIFGHHCCTGAPEELNLLLARCSAADLIGTLMALIAHREGERAFEEFSDAIAEASAKALGIIEAATTEGPDHG
jgi:hypothetical protein